MMLILVLKTKCRRSGVVLLTICRYSVTMIYGRRLSGNHDDDVRVVDNWRIIGNSDERMSDVRELRW